MPIVEVVMSARDFQGTTYYYLRALSLTDLAYLLFVIGYYSEVLTFLLTRENRSLGAPTSSWRPFGPV